MNSKTIRTLTHSAMTRTASVAIIAAGMTGLFMGASFAQQKPPTAPAQQRPAQPAAPAAEAAPQGPTVVTLKSEPSQPEWVKVCGEDQQQKKQVCYTTRDFVAENNQPVLAAAIYEVKADKKQIIRFLMPLGFMLAPGVRFGVDAQQATAGRYQICFPNGCFVEAEVKEEFIAQMKKGNNLKIDVQNQVGSEVAFIVPLAGFGKAFDGAPIDPKVLEEQQKKLQEALQKQTEELQKQQQQAPAAAQPK